MIYTITIGLSAFLLFLIQPMITKMLLPGFGGGASIWITSLVFFQTTLLIGYGATHWLVRSIGLHRHMMLLASMLGISLLILPIAAPAIGVSSSPSLSLFLMLAISVGLPYLVLSTTSPTLQYWMANDEKAQRQNPYIQYGVSNGGSLLGLLAYPFLVEPLLSNSSQSWIWSAAYIVYALLLLATMVLYVRANKSQAIETIDLSGGVRPLRIFQALVPSAALIVVTHYLTLDVVNLPLLWVAPLCVYLASFIVCFLYPRISEPNTVRTFLGVLSILLLMLANSQALTLDFNFKITVALLCLFAICMIFHGDLERGKPHKKNLTHFYLHLATGGALGSILAGIVAPLVFDTTFEFYVVVVVALYYIVASNFTFTSAVSWLLRGCMILALGYSYLVQEFQLGDETIHRTRTFYSTYAVRDVGIGNSRVRKLVAGTHIHGKQFQEGANEHMPLAYFHRDTGIGRLFQLLEPNRVALVGLGIGTVVEYGDETTSFDIYEIDQAVIDLALEFFTTLSESKADISYYVGDGRLNLRKSETTYDLIVMDAFSSGSIPTHLVTLEALTEVMEKLSPDGAIAYHISNHHLDLLPVLNAIADELDLSILYHQSAGADGLHKYPAKWVVLSRIPDLSDLLIARDERWKMVDAEKILWLDDFSNIWSIIRMSE